MSGTRISRHGEERALNNQSRSPWFETAKLGRARGRLLLISYHFPPSLAVGGLRWQKLARVASDRGWELDVLAADPAELPRRDDARLGDLPAGVRIYPIPRPVSLPDRLERGFFLVRNALRPRESAPVTSSGRSSTRPSGREEGGSLARADIRFNPLRPRDYARAFHAWSDVARDAAWSMQARRVGETLVADRTRYAAVISCGPPHHGHVAGSALAARAGIPHVMDLRDPWSLQQRLVEGVASPVWFAMTRRAEARTLAKASLLVCNTPSFLEAMRLAFPGAPARRITVLNGWDAEPLPAAPSRERFVVAYAGSIYLDRDPGPLFAAIRRLVEARHLSPAYLEIAFMGDVQSYGGQTLPGIAAAAGVGEYLRLVPARGRREVMEFLSSASVLVSLPQDSDLAIPSKVFEYMLFPAWLLALAEPGSATAEVLAGTEAAVVAPKNVGAIAAALDHWYGEFEAHRFPAPIGLDTRLGRLGQGALLFSALEELLAEA